MESLLIRGIHLAPLGSEAIPVSSKDHKDRRSFKHAENFTEQDMRLFAWVAGLGMKHSADKVEQGYLNASIIGTRQRPVSAMSQAKSLKTGYVLSNTRR